MSEARLGRVQLRIMRVLWQRGQATARNITDALQDERPIAHSTVQTLLRKLEDKGAVRHRVEDRTFVFLPAIAERRVTRSAARDLVQRVFGGNAAGLIAHLLQEEKIAPKEIEELRKLIEQKAAKRK